jgi:hypothetical protein
MNESKSKNQANNKPKLKLQAKTKYNNTIINNRGDRAEQQKLASQPKHSQLSKRRD